VHLGKRLDGLDSDAELLGQLALEALQRRLAGLGLAAGQVEDVGRRLLADQQQAARPEHGGGDDPEHGSGIPLVVDDWRDLGGIRTTDGRTIRPGALVRARSLDHLDDDDWAAIHALGVRTLIDLRNEDERAAAPAPRGITAVHVPLDSTEDRAFWDEWSADWRFGTPVYYGPHIARFPERSLGVLTAIAYARPGGVLYHCMGGRDRTGMITMLVLALVGVAPDDIAADYELSAAMSVDANAVTEGLTRAGTTARAELLRALAEVDLDALVCADLRASLCARLLERTAAE
jgi:hypothetical protein